MLGVTPWGLKACGKVQSDYNEESWMSLKSHFRTPKEDVKFDEVSNRIHTKGI